MGIGLNDTDAIVGNIGASSRSNYSAVGSGVNMTSRIESYTVGGQILISESVRKEAQDVLRIDGQQDVQPKGVDAPLRIYEVGAIAGPYNLVLFKKKPTLITLTRQIPLEYQVLEGKDIGKMGLEGSVIRLSRTSAEIILTETLEALANIKMNLRDVNETLAVKSFYGKVIEQAENNEKIHRIRFTSVPPEIDAYFQSHRQHSAIFETS